MVTLICADGQSHELDGSLPDGVSAGDLTAATGWQLKPEGLCRDDVCIPVRTEIGRPDGRIDVIAWSATLGHDVAVDEAYEVVAQVPAARRSSELAVGAEAPDLELLDLEGNPHRLSDLHGRKRVLVTWASWCGCRHELGAWDELQEELAATGLALYSVALDESPDAARPWVEAASPSYPVVVDPAHVTAERFGITNVPSTVWIDEDGRVVKPPTIAPGDDQFKDFTKISSSAHHEALRRWVRDGVAPDVDDVPIVERSPEERLALAEQRIATVLASRGQRAAALPHLQRAVELAPWDWTVRRAAIAMRGDDPFLGEEFIAFWQEWDAAGRPGYRSLPT